MARKPEPDDDFEDDDTPVRTRKKGMPAWAWVLITVGIPALICGGGGLLVTALLWSTAKPIPTAPTLPGKVETKVYTREEFRKLVVGKTPEEVIEAVGRPESTDDSMRIKVYYRYTDRTLDPITGKVDHSVTVAFEDGVCIWITY